MMWRLTLIIIIIKVTTYKRLKLAEISVGPSSSLLESEVIRKAKGVFQSRAARKEGRIPPKEVPTEHGLSL